ncbi:MAG: Stk1 family PASTA domain-containing Ser/Thr kinase [Tissierellia bacterium]|nr:Stk1 family PASTA domain-containing Ser/Thr kinase [Tissierellia bacterium]
MIGKILGNRYEILEKIGTGGMGNVYKAHCKRLDRIVAIKILKLQYNDDNNFIRKFKRESLAAASISHPNIVSIYDVGSEAIDGELCHYIVMEYIDGKTLKEIINDEGRLSEKRALNYCIQIAEALKVAHSKHIVHRDIKAQNIMVTRDDRVKVTDFGIARVADNTTVTATNAVMGSVHYFSPEQAKGAKVDNRSDIYSLGIVLYEMLTGTLPFDADNPVSVALMQVQSNMPRPSETVRSLDPEIDELVLKMTRKDPNKRYGDVFELIRDIKSITLTGRRKDHNAHGYHTDPSATLIQPIPSENKRYVNRKNNSSHSKDYSEPVKKKKKKSVAPAILGIICGVLIIGLLAYIAPKALGGLNKPKEVEMIILPNFVGETKEKVELEADALGVNLDIAFDEDKEKSDNEILAQDPVADTEVEKGSTVKVIINNLPDSVTVPSVVNMTLDEAKEMLKDHNLSLGKVDYEFSDDVEEDKIISQNPNAGYDIAKDQTVSIVISKGEDSTPWSMLALRGISEEKAKATLKKAGMKVKIEYGETNDVDEGQVYKQSVDVGSPLQKGDEVTLWISTGAPTGSLDLDDEKDNDINNKDNDNEEESSSNIPTKTVKVQVPDDGQRHRVVAKRVVNSRGNTVDTVVWNYGIDSGDQADVELIGKGKYEIYINDRLIRKVDI